MNVMVLGASGQLGKDLIDILSKDKTLNIIAITRNELNVELDINNVITKLSMYVPDVIINCIATTNVDWCELNSELAFKINANFIYMLALLCKKNQIKLIHLSTDYVFDGKKDKPYEETDIPQPQNVYGITKYSGELIINGYLDKYFIFRVSGLFGKYGASGKGGNFITTMQKLAREKNEFNVIVDQFSNPTSTLEVARCIYYFLINQIDNYGVYHCVSQNFCSWYDFGKEILTLSNLDTHKIKPIEFSRYHFKAKRPQNSILSTKKLSQYYVLSTWQDSLKEYMELIDN
ncbi:MAG: dTDP-4-dehydrorhamnose reductase [Neisseriaceae bacterium]